MSDEPPSLQSRILSMCKSNTHKPINSLKPDFSGCVLWPRNCQTTRPTINDNDLGTVDVRNILYVNYRKAFEKGFTAVPSTCNKSRCVNPYHATVVTETDERCNNYIRAGEQVARKISTQVDPKDRQQVHKTVMNDIIFATYLLEKRWNSINSFESFYKKADRYASSLRVGVQKASKRLKTGMAFRIYCLTNLKIESP